MARHIEAMATTPSPANVARSSTAVVRVNKWEEAITISRRLVRWAYRGHAVESWNLANSFARQASVYNIPRHYWRLLEYYMIRQFQRQAHLLIHSPPHEDAALDWLSVIQHYGGPTRLLDFTYSYYVAVFFALESATSDAAVWAVDLGFLDKVNNEGVEFREPASGVLSNRLVWNDRWARMANEILIGQDVPSLGILHLEPIRLNARMAAQKGLFLTPKRLDVPFVDNFAAALQIDPSMVIPGRDAEHISVREFLKRMVSQEPYRVAKIVFPSPLRQR